MAVVLLGWHTGMITPGYAASAHPAAVPAVITAWTHEDVNSRQFQVLLKAAETFNRRQHAYRVEIVPSLRRD